MLKHEADAALSDMAMGDLVTVQQNGAAVRSFQARQDTQQGRLSAPRWTKQCDQFAGTDVERDIADRGEGMIRFCYAANVNTHARRSFASDEEFHSTRLFAIKVTTDNEAKREATANAAT